jgi:RNA polymerase sigma-70 factor (ECF subfamily)
LLWAVSFKLTKSEIVQASATPEEHKLVRLSLAGDRRAARQLYEKYVHAMFHTATRLVGNVEDAEDVTQEAFIRVFQGLEQFKAESTLGAWIKRIVVNTALNFLRQRNRISILSIEEGPEPGAREESREEPSWQLEDIHRGIKELPDRCRLVLSLYLLEGYQHKEIAQILGITESTSKTQYRRGKELLRQNLIALQTGTHENR